MGLKEYMAEKAVEIGAKATVEALRVPAAMLGNAIGNAADAIGDAMESRAAKQDAEYIAKRPANRHVIIKMDDDDGKLSVNVVDIDGRILYTGKGSMSKIMTSLKIKSFSGKPVAKIKKAIIAARNPLKHEENPADFDITLDDGGNITVKTVSNGYHDYDIEPYGWKVDWKPGGYTVYNEEEDFFYYDESRWHSSKTYIIDFKRNLNIEKMAVLITLAIMLHEKWKDLE